MTTTEAPLTSDAVGSNRWYLSTAPIIRALVHLCVPMAAAMRQAAIRGAHSMYRAAWLVGIIDRFTSG